MCDVFPKLDDLEKSAVLFWSALINYTKVSYLSFVADIVQIGKFNWGDWLLFPLSFSDGLWFSEDFRRK